MARKVREEFERLESENKELREILEKILKERDAYKQRSELAERALQEACRYIDSLGESCGCCAFIEDKLKCKENCDFLNGLTKYFLDLSKNYVNHENEEVIEDNTMLTVSGNKFWCDCGCNVFSKIKTDENIVYECHSCKKRYISNEIVG